ncbi:Uncharacterised protein [Mycobacteroides abscessus subsp. abscessus]|nr:Uncharacterised protein [Mycobacteroides abscessus subsp. abscessus]SIN58181.1 Uncharacterised protein [Mycobacteroides abscessus subsp. abscessus]
MITYVYASQTMACGTETPKIFIVPDSCHRMMVKETSEITEFTAPNAKCPVVVCSVSGDDDIDTKLLISA